ncbi:LysR family transcriptional regulator [Vibrio genomosp. F10]|uniref:LysR family transcriptional regulator n=1 Tax=Vibrio genomosp. F10 TaxID=723171 RepID=UPI000303BF72|nr:LysR family transcriptional regulator [Vibrio genomosp. F10]OEF06965.1 LysR family transcriptional regulator [Vibrio genomosp. F10 str. 9ZB36]OEF11201.1 LysR family transcriptional regulator [Vibrio genomosp. F10 str. 9ZD137]
MKIELLTTFLEVARTLHFRVASENLYLTQSAVSARIKLLEEELGVLLFDRSHKNLKMTAEGHRMIKHANDMIFMWNKTKQDVGIAENDAHQLVIGSVMSIWDIVLQGWLKKIHRNIDDVSLYTSTYSPTELRKNVLNRLMDVAFLFEPPFIDDMKTEKVATVPLYLVTTHQNTQYQDLLLDDYIVVDYGESVNSQHTRAFKDVGAAKHHINQPRVALNFILDAGGSAYLPKQMAFEYVSNDRLFIVEDAPIYSREIYAIYLAKSHKVELIEQALHLFPGVEI